MPKSLNTRNDPWTPTQGEFRDCDTSQTIAQIGRMTTAAISGLRVTRRSTGITMPVSNGYSVTVDLDWDDTYVVRRMFQRGSKMWIKGEQRGVYCEDVSECAYQASSFRSNEF